MVASVAPGKTTRTSTSAARPPATIEATIVRPAVRRGPATRLLGWDIRRCGLVGWVSMVIVGLLLERAEPGRLGSGRGRASLAVSTGGAHDPAWGGGRVTAGMVGLAGALDAPPPPGPGGQGAGGGDRARAHDPRQCGPLVGGCPPGHVATDPDLGEPRERCTCDDHHHRRKQSERCEQSGAASASGPAPGPAPRPDDT